MVPSCFYSKTLHLLLPFKVTGAQGHVGVSFLSCAWRGSHRSRVFHRYETTCFQGYETGLVLGYETQVVQMCINPTPVHGQVSLCNGGMKRGNYETGMKREPMKNINVSYLSEALQTKQCFITMKRFLFHTYETGDCAATLF